MEPVVRLRVRLRLLRRLSHSHQSVQLLREAYTEVLSSKDYKQTYCREAPYDRRQNSDLVRLSLDSSACNIESALWTRCKRGISATGIDRCQLVVKLLISTGLLFFSDQVAVNWNDVRVKRPVDDRGEKPAYGGEEDDV
jgi:hypothetical protein